MALNWQELSRCSLPEIVAWAKVQPWGRAMAECQQDAGWHAEGDVWTHTQMVCRELTQLSDWPILTGDEQLQLIFTALFHDAGKPQTSHVDPETGRIRSPKHALVGEHLARSCLRELACDLLMREKIARLVRYHGRPAFLLERSDPAREVVSLSWSVSHKLLYLFALADTRGRATQEMTRPEENLWLWKEVALEKGCFDQPYAFSNAQARFLFFRQTDANLHYVPHEEYRCTVTMMSGLPGSGKNYWLEKSRPELPIISLDEIRDELEVRVTDNQGEVAQLARERCRELLRSRTSFAFNATNLLRQTRQRWIDLFADYGARIEIVYIEPPLDQILSQNKRRQKPVPEKIILNLAAKSEPPHWTEAHELVYWEGKTSI